MISLEEFFEELQPDQVEKFQNALKDLEEIFEILNDAQKEFLDVKLREAVIRDDNDLGKNDISDFSFLSFLNPFRRDAEAKYYSVGSINAQLGRLAKIE